MEAISGHDPYSDEERGVGMMFLYLGVSYGIKG